MEVVAFQEPWITTDDELGCKTLKEDRSKSRRHLRNISLKAARPANKIGLGRVENEEKLRNWRGNKLISLRNGISIGSNTFCHTHSQTFS